MEYGGQLPAQVELPFGKWRSNVVSVTDVPSGRVESRSVTLYDPEDERNRISIDVPASVELNEATVAELARRPRERVAADPESGVEWRFIPLRYPTESLSVQTAGQFRGRIELPEGTALGEVSNGQLLELVSQLTASDGT